MDSCNPEIISPLSGGKKGVRVVITCLQSGQRCFLENPQPPEACNCAKDVGDQSIGNFWEVECHSASQVKGMGVYASNIPFTCIFFL